MYVKRTGSGGNNEKPAAAPVSYTTNEQAHTTVNVVGFVVLGIALGVAYFVWPQGALDLPVGAITLGAWLRIAGAGLVGFVGLCFAISLCS